MGYRSCSQNGQAFDILPQSAETWLTMSSRGGASGDFPAMAENETLHLGDKRNRRWRHLCDGVLKGATPEETAKRAARCVVSVMKNILRYDPARGGPEYPVGELLEAMQKGPEETNRVLARCDGHQYAHLLAEEDASGGAEAILSKHFERVVGNFLEQVGLEAMPERFRSFPEFQSFCRQVEAEVRPQLRELAKQVAANPTKPPRSSPRPKAEREAATSTILRESLLSRVGVR